MVLPQERDSVSEPYLPLPDNLAWIYPHFFKHQERNASPEKSLKALEREFLIAELPPDLLQLTPIVIQEGYLQLDKGEELSIKIEGSVRTVTLKKTDRTVLNIPIHENNLFEQLWSQARLCCVIKHRYEYIGRHDAHPVTIDIYQGNHKGLVRVKVKFNSEAEASSFKPSYWFGAEITGEIGLRNRNLAVHGVPLPSVDRSRAVTEQGILVDQIPEAQMTSLLEMVGKRFSADKVTVLAIGGRPGSGKSSVIERIRQEFGNQHVVVLPLDHYLYNIEYIHQLQQNGSDVTLYHPQAIRWPVLQADVDSLVSGRAIRMPLNAYGESDHSEIVQPTKIIIVEGPLALHLESPYHSKVFVESNLRTSLFKWLITDLQRQEGQIGEKKDPIAIIKYYLTHIQSMYEEFVIPTKAQANHVLTNQFYAPTKTGRWGTQKSQLKFQANSEVIHTLFGLQAKELTQITHLDYYFKSGNTSRDEYLRIREVNGQAVLTFVSDSIHTEIQYFLDAHTRDFLLGNYDFERIEKKRTIYQMGSILITVTELDRSDATKPRGLFVEITAAFGEDIQEQIKKVVKALHLDEREAITDPYSLMHY